MGLGFSVVRHERVDAGWSYSGFHRFRERLAKAIGIDLNQMEGFNRDKGHRIEAAISWDTVKDPIVGLLNHSDCDGTLVCAECKTIGPRLREIVSAWDDDYDKESAIALADAMDECAREDLDLRFC